MSNLLITYPHAAYYITVRAVILCVSYRYRSYLFNWRRKEELSSSKSCIWSLSI